MPFYTDYCINQSAYVERANGSAIRGEPSHGKELPTAKTFLITGVSSGFGRALAEAALRDGHAVAGTVRKDGDKKKFETLGKGAHAVILDVTDTGIAPAVAASRRKSARSTCS